MYIYSGDFWKQAIYAGFSAGLAFLLAEMLLVMTVGQSAFTPLHMVAAILLGREVLSPSSTLELSVIAAAVVVHFPLAVVYGIMIGWLVRKLSPGQAVVVGAAAGLIIYWVNFYIFASFVFEWFAQSRNWINVLTHLLFGVVAAWVFAISAGPRSNLNE